MTPPKSVISKPVLAAVLGTGLLLGTTGVASAYVVCNDEGDCWHTDHRYHHPGVHLQFRDDEWYFHHHWGRDWDHDYDYDADRRYRWRDYHEGRGYWRNGVWITF